MDRRNISVMHCYRLDIVQALEASKSYNGLFIGRYMDRFPLWPEDVDRRIGFERYML